MIGTKKNVQISEKNGIVPPKITYTNILLCLGGGEGGITQALCNTSTILVHLVLNGKGSNWSLQYGCWLFLNKNFFSCFKYFCLLCCCFLIYS